MIKLTMGDDVVPWVWCPYTLKIDYIPESEKAEMKTHLERFKNRVGFSEDSKTIIVYEDVVIGREGQLRIRESDYTRGVSRGHCRLILCQNKILDTASSNGTTIIRNGQPTVLRSTDKVLQENDVLVLHERIRFTVHF